jgi:hypothetical protein
MLSSLYQPLVHGTCGNVQCGVCFATEFDRRSQPRCVSVAKQSQVSVSPLGKNGRAAHAPQIKIAEISDLKFYAAERHLQSRTVTRACQVIGEEKEASCSKFTLQSPSKMKDMTWSTREDETTLMMHMMLMVIHRNLETMIMLCSDYGTRLHELYSYTTIITMYRKRSDI